MPNKTVNPDKTVTPHVILQGADDDVTPPRMSENHARFFTALHDRRVIPGVGHNVPQEAPQAFADAVLHICRNASA